MNKNELRLGLTLLIEYRTILILKDSPKLYIIS